MRTVLMAGGALAALLASVPAIADVKAGVDAWRRGDFKAAVEQWRPLAIAGDADAQYNLGQAYKLGRGVPVDPVLAESWFGKAAVQGHEQAQENYGIALFQDDKKADAVPWLERAIGRDAPRAELVYGTMLFNGDGVPRDYPRAYALMTRAAAPRDGGPGLPSAAETLTQMDGYIGAADRERGTVLARQYEARARSAQIAGTSPGMVSGMGVTDLPPAQAEPARRPTDMRAPRGETRTPVHPSHDDRPAPREMARSDMPPPLSGRGGGERPEHTAVDRAAPAGRPAPERGAPLAREHPPLRARPPVREQAAPVRAATRGWRVQLGAFGEPGNAHALWNRLSSRFGGVDAAYVKAGRVTRLQAGPYRTWAEAQRACATARVSCAVIAP